MCNDNNNSSSNWACCHIARIHGVCAMRVYVCGVQWATRNKAHGMGAKKPDDISHHRRTHTPDLQDATHKARHSAVECGVGGRVKRERKFRENISISHAHTEIGPYLGC